MKTAAQTVLHLLLLLACLTFFAGAAFGGVKLIQAWHDQNPPADQTPVAPCDSGPPLTSC